VKKSRVVHIPLVSTLAAAALAAGCGSSPQPAAQQGWQTCVDRGKGTAVEQQYCDDEVARSSGPGYVPHYFWYYYPRSYYWAAPPIGSPVPQGGAYSLRPFNSTPMARTGVVRGGFGSTASGHASTGS
jgi:hypothetical protein